MSNFIEFIKEDVLLFDIIFIIIIFYNMMKCLSQGFTVSFFSSLKWIVAAILTIILVPKLQPWVSNYIESEFINNIGIGVFILLLHYLLVLF